MPSSTSAEVSATRQMAPSIAGLTSSGATSAATPPLARRVLVLALLALGYFATALGGLAISRQAGNIATLWPPNGMLVAALMLTTRRRWGDVLLAGMVGSLAANMYNGNTALTACSITLANLVEALIAATIIRTRTGRRLLFQQSSDVVVLIAAAVTAAVVAGTLSAASAALLAHAPFTSIFVKWVLGDLLGLLVVMPIAIIVHDLIKHGPDIILSGRTQSEATLVMAAVVLVSVGVFAPQAPPVQFLVMPAVLLASYRLGPFGAAMSTTIVAVLGSVGTAAAAQALASSPYEVTLKVFNFQLNLAVLFLTALPIGSAMAQRSQLEHDLVDEKDRADRYAADMATLVNIDDLTGLSTRRHLLEELDRLAAAARRAEQPLTLAMIDIDHFKPINDQFGHAVGDAVLMAIGAACRSAVRAEDVIGRLGGEEFAMLMPLTDQVSAFRIVDRLRQSVAEITIPVSDGRTVSVTISVGVATFVGQQIDRLLLDADRALYLAKETGRNRIVLAERGMEVS